MLYWGTIGTTYGYLNTLKGVLGFCHCPKGSKGFRLGLGQGQKVSLDTDTFLTFRGSSRGTKTDRRTHVVINDNLVNSLDTKEVKNDPIYFMYY